MDASTGHAYRERLWVPWWWWPLAVVVIALLGAEIHVGLGWVVAVVTYTVLAAFVVVMLLRHSVRVGVHDGALTAGRFRVPLTSVTETRILDRGDVRQVLARRPDPNAVVLVRGYLPRVVYLGVETESGGSYWLVSSRHPDALAAAAFCETGRSREAGQ
ncbi:MAG: DUF3093 family protein [Streptosporangiales bacterium]|nr:DUF3093 family protein [Streptosporangiales bacterium]MBO0890579.1 DUF3093 family protein [Acidothermales bacterium]